MFNFYKKTTLQEPEKHNKIRIDEIVVPTLWINYLFVMWIFL